MFSNMKPAERKLLEACQKGEILDLGNKRPIEKTVDNEIRGEFLQHLILSNNQEIEESGKKYVLKINLKGIMFSGLYVSGEFDFSFCSTDLPFLFTNLIFENEIILNDSKIKCLSLDGSKVESLYGQRLICESGIFLTNKFEASGQIDFHSAQIGGLDCYNGKFYSEHEYALLCDYSEIKGEVSLSGKEFESKGEVSFNSAQISKNLDCTDAKFTNENNRALTCNGANIKGAVFLDDVKVNGEVNFNSAEIGKTLDCPNGKFINKKGTSLNCDRAKIKDSVNLRNGFISEGRVNFNSAEIGGSFSCKDGKFINEGNNALTCQNIKVNGDVFLNDGFNVVGNVHFSSSQIEKALILSNLEIKGIFNISSAKINEIELNDNILKKDKLKNIYLDGLEYNHLSGKNLDSKILINLLEKMPEFKPQPYRQLVKVLRNNGDNIYADDIMIKYNDIQASKNNIFLKNLKKIYKITTGYGYRPKNMLGTLIIVWLIFGWIYQKTAEMAVFAPSNPLIFQKKDFYQCVIDENGTSFSDLCNQKEYNEQNNWTKSKKLEGEYTTFQPYIYSLDLILPVVDLQMNKDWGVFISPTNSNFTLNDLIRWIVWIEIIIGWTLGYILLSYLSGIISKRD